MAALKPQTPEWVKQAPLRIIETRTIQATPSAIWTELIDNESWVYWFPGFRESSFTTPPPHDVGSIRLVHQDQFKVQEKITTWKPNAEWGMTVIDINVPVIKAMAENVHVIERGNTTEVQWHIGVEISWWARPISKALAAKSRSGLKKALEQLDDRVTAG